MDTSENVEAAIVAGESILAAVSGFILAAPIPIEWKSPLLGLTGGIALAIFAFWKAKVNKL
jgi:hypothetical protein